MTTNQQIKAPMHAPKVSPDSGALQGARRATEDAPESAPAIPPLASDTEVVPRARRRTFTKADKRRILHEADQCTKPGGGDDLRPSLQWCTAHIGHLAGPNQPCCTDFGRAQPQHPLGTDALV